MNIALKSYFPFKHDPKVIAQGYARTEDGARAFIKFSHSNGASCDVLIRACKGSTLTVTGISDYGDEDLDIYCCTVGLNTVERMCKQVLKNVTINNDNINELTLFAV